MTPTLVPKTSKMKCTPAAPSNFLVSVPRAVRGPGIRGPGSDEDGGQDLQEPSVRDPGFGGSGLKMKVAKTLVAIGLAVVGLAGVAFLDLHGSGNSLRGGSPTKPLGTRAAFRRALLETVAYGTRQVNRRRLQETAMNCGKVDTIVGDVLGCVYPSNPFDQSGTQAHCLFDSVVQDGLLAPDSALVPLLEKKSEVFNARPGHVTFPYGEAASLGNDMKSICAAPVEGEDRRRGLSTMSQDTFVTQVTNHLKEIEAVCVGHTIENNAHCQDFLIVLEIGLTVADLG